jgi:Carboxypeptidase regulatory-like domain
MFALIPIFMLVCLSAQRTAAATLSGTVTDASGTPVKDARIDHTGRLVVVSLLVEPSPDDARTDADGRFRVTTVAPAIVVRKPGYISKRVPVTDDAEVQIILQRITAGPQCKLSPPPKVKTKKANDVDYTATWFYIQTKGGPKGILSGSGPSYSLGAPLNSDVWASIDYAEVMYESGMIDASGHTADGKYWRSRSKLGAAAQYYNVNRETAEQLDCVMDGVNLR